MLKECHDGLSKAWSVGCSHEPFYSGGKIEISQDENIGLCMHDEGISSLNWVSGLGTSWLKLDDSDSRESITSFCLHPNGTEVTVATRLGLIKQYRISDKACLRTIRGHKMPVLAMAYDPSGNFVATGSADRSVRVWDINGGFCTHSFKDHSDIVQRVSFDPNATSLRLFSCSDDNTIRVYDLVSQQCVGCFKDHMSLPTAISVSFDGKLLASVSRDKVMNLYCLVELSHLKTVAVMDVLEGVVFLGESHSCEILGLPKTESFAATSKRSHGHSKSKDLSTDRNHVIALAGETGIIRLFRLQVNANNSSLVCAPLFNVEATWSPAEVKVNFDATGRTGHDLKSLQVLLAQPPAQRAGAATASAGAVSVTVEDQEASETLAHARAVTSLHYLPRRGELVAVTGDNNICSFSISEKGLSFSRQLVGSNDDILDIAYVPSEATPSSPSAKHEHLLALVTNSPQVRLLGDMVACYPLNGHADIVLAVDVSPSGEWICTSSKDRTCRVWRTSEQRCYAVAEGHTDAVGAVAISQRAAAYDTNLAFMASGSGDKILKRWSLPTRAFHVMAEAAASSAADAADGDAKESQLGKNINIVLKLTASHNVRAHEKDINTVAVSPNDALIASGSQDKTIRLWQSTDLTAVATLSGHKRGVWKVAFSPIDRCLVSCSGDRTLRLWSVVDFSCLRTFEGHTGSVLSVRFVNRGMQLLSGSADGLIRLWTIRTGECEATLEQHEDKVWALAVPRPAAASSSSSAALTDGAVPLAAEDDVENDDEVDDHEPSEKEDGVAQDAGKVSVSAEATEGMQGGISGMAGVGVFFSGGSDSRLLGWKDVTLLEERERVELLEKDLVVEQQMQNDLRNKRFGKALNAALSLGHSSRVVGILMAILEEDVEPASAAVLSTADAKEAARPQVFASSSSAAATTQVFASSSSAAATRPRPTTGAVVASKQSLEEVEAGGFAAVPISLRLDGYVAALTDQEIEKVVTYLKDWVTNARYCFVSNVLISSLLRVCGVPRLLELREVSQALPGLIAYSERHFQRISRLYQATYLADYLGSLMSILPPLDSAADGATATAIDSADGETDAESSSSKGLKRKKLKTANPVLFAGNFIESEEALESRGGKEVKKKKLKKFL